MDLKPLLLIYSLTLLFIYKGNEMENKAKTVKRRILVIDKEESIHNEFRTILLPNPSNSILSAKNISFDVDCAFDGHQGLEMLVNSQRQGRPYAMVFVDIRLESDWDGIETVEYLWKVRPVLQVVICTGYSDYSWEDISNRLGTNERFLILKKPFESIEVMQLAIAMTEKMELLNQLDNLVQERTAQITETRDVAMFILASLAESRDPETGEHLERIRSYCHILAEEIRGNPDEYQGYSEQIDQKFIEDLYHSSPLHDIGKVGIPDSILLKPSSLLDDEFEIMKQHTIIGADAFARAIRTVDSAGFLEMAADIAHYHHERFDGTGYPEGLKGTKIPLCARIVALADVYDALTSSRIYKPAFGADISDVMIRQERGKHFDPVIVDAFIARHNDFLQVRHCIEAERISPTLI